MELLIGCGHRRIKHIMVEGRPSFDKLVTLDNNPEVKPDVVYDLEGACLPFADNTFDEIHAYEVLEHLGTQGDYKFFFKQFDDFARVLKPDGWLLFTCPRLDSPWVWGDPGHKRYIGKEVLYFLDRSHYEEVGATPLSDYRNTFQSNWQLIYEVPESESTAFVLRNVK